MTNAKNTKRALLSSVLALFLCFAMLLGSTFAWFTDSVTSANNIIKSGNLDIELEYAKVVDGKITDWATVQDADKIFDPNALWEPGRVEVVYLKVSNLGTLALKYQLGVNVVNEIGGKNVEGADFMLSDHLVFKVVEMPDALSTYTDREAVTTAAGTEKGLKDYNGETTPLEVGGIDYVALIVYMPENVGNEANYRGDAIPTIELGVNLYATQQMDESDSFGNNYDEYAGLPWDGSTGEVPAEVEGVITITNASELAALAVDVNSGNTYSGKTVKLAADLNLAGKTWTPIGQNGDKAGFQGTFDGQGHTISNLYVNQTSRAYQAAGLFGSTRYATIKDFKIVNATINNLDATGDSSNGAAVVVGAAQYTTTIDNVDVENATVIGNRRVAAIAGYYVGTITNCDVKNVNLTANVDDLGNGSYDNGDKVGMIIAYSNGASTISNNTVTGGTIVGYRDIGGIAGYADTSTLTDNKVSDLSIVVNNAHNYKSYADLDAHDAGEIIGEGDADATNVASNVTIEMPVASTEDLIAAINAGETEIELAPGNYTMPTSFNGSGVSLQGKTLTIKGTKDVVIEASHVDERDQYVTGATLAFEGVTLNFGTTNYMGFANAESLTYTDCTINGLQFCYGSGEYSFVNCDLNSNGAEHCVWTWGGQNVSFTGCDFTYADRAVNCYGENVTTNASFTNCTFTKVAGKETTGAIETNSSTLTALNLTINNCTVNEGELWFIAGWDSLGGAKTTVTVDGATDNGVIIVQSGVLPYLRINSNSTYMLAGDFNNANVELKMAEGVENVVFDGSNATNINELIIVQNGKLIDHADDHVGDRSGKVTVKNFNVLSQINVFACKTEVEICNNTAEALMVHAGNCALKIHDNVIDGNFEQHPTYSSATTTWNNNQYGITLNIYDYDLWFDNNVVTDAYSHAVGINGWQGTYNTDDQNVIHSFTGNKITVNSTEKTERAAIKIFDDETYANRDDDHAVVNATAQELINTILAGGNTFTLEEGKDHVIFEFYDARTNS